MTRQADGDSCKSVKMHLVRADDGAVGHSSLEFQIGDAAGGAFHPHGFRSAGEGQIGLVV